MKKIPDKSIDMILCDLPYGETRSKWDKVLDFDKLWEQYLRVIKDTGAIVLFGNEPFSSMLRQSQPDLYRYDWKWIKNRATGFANCNYRPMRMYEDIIVFSKANASAGGKNNSMVYNPQGLVEVNKTKKNTSNRKGLISYNNNNLGENNSLNGDSEYTQKYTNYPNNLLYFDCEKKYIHPTQKPVELLEYLIKTYTNEGNLVLDNCMGSGSTGVAALNLNRNFIGIELDENYFNIAKERIEGIVNK
jgi:site-specific DNA-methyltransferase (adenine-specific)